MLPICLRISPQIFATVQKFAMDDLRDQQFCTLPCELEWLVVVLFTGNAIEVEVPPGMVWASRHFQSLVGNFSVVMKSSRRFVASSSLHSAK